MTTELNLDRKKPIDFTFNEKKLAVQTMPLKLMLRLQQAMTDDGRVDVDVELMSDILSQCVVYADTGKRVWPDDKRDNIENADGASMALLFQAVSNVSMSVSEQEAAEKN